MKDYLKHYRVTIRALSPIYIGSGVQLGKKEYLYMPWNHRVIVPDFEKMYMTVQKKGLQREFDSYMMNSRNNLPSLSQWMKQHQFRNEDYEVWKRYEMDAGDAFATQTGRPKGIDTFIKDAYGKPYVPGSSIKGMFRTALIAWEIQNNPRYYARTKREIERSARERASRKQCLAKETNYLEQQVLYTLNRDETKAGSAVNDNMSGLHVGDSVPISVEQLTLCQKIDYTLEREEKCLPLLREVLKPGTEITFDVSIDTTLCPYCMEDIMEALNVFNGMCNRYFYARFCRSTKDKDIIWLGGGAGFPSKTVHYALFGGDAYRVIDSIFKNTLGVSYNKHKHSKDIRLKLAPHVCKCTRYNGKLYDMGKGQISYTET